MHNYLTSHDSTTTTSLYNAVWNDMQQRSKWTGMELQTTMSRTEASAHGAPVLTTMPLDTPILLVKATLTVVRCGLDLMALSANFLLWPLTKKQ